MEKSRINRAVVTLVRNRQSPDDYHIRFDFDEEKALKWIQRYIDQFDYDVELGTHIIFEIEREPEPTFDYPAQVQARKFIDYLKNVVATNYKENNFFSGWYEFKDITCLQAWFDGFDAYKVKIHEDFLKSNFPSRQTSLF